MLDDLLFLGSDYENAFARFEILMSLEYMHQTDGDWGPVGRFGKKPLQQLIDEVQQQGVAWAPLRAGLFNGSEERLNQVLERLKVRNSSGPVECWH